MSDDITTKFQEQRREIVFKGQLQQKITKRFGTLLRKKVGSINIDLNFI